MKYLALLFTICVAASALPPLPEGVNGKADFELAQISRKYAKESYPKGKVDAWWSNFTEKQAAAFYPYRYMHAMVVAAFYAKRKDHSQKAFKWLNEYRCENAVACADFLSFYDGALKANILSLKPAERKNPNRIRAAAEARLKTLHGPKSEGLCAAASPRSAWLEQEYALLCGPAPGPNLGFCPGCELTKDFQFKLEMDTHQSLMSSSYVEAFEHQGPADCSAPWKSVIKCGVTGKTHTVECAREGESFPVTVRCKDI